MATIMVTPKAPAEIRVICPRSNKMPPKNSTPETNGVRICGKGIPHETKFSVVAGRLLSFPQPLHKNTQPTTMRANSGASHARCRAVRSGQPIRQSISVFIMFVGLSSVGVGLNRHLRIRPEDRRSYYE